jgi:hypothetical protein
MNRYHVERRRFLKMVGATALTYPFLRGVPSFAAGGQTSAPMYLVLLYTSCGVVRPMWGAYGPPATGASAMVTPLTGSVTDGGLGGFRPTLSVFEAEGLTSQVNVLDGLNNLAADGGTHEAGMASLWTGATLATDGQHATGESIDQAINAALLNQGVKTSQAPLALYAPSSTDDPSRDVHNRMLYQPPQEGISDYFDPIFSPSAAMTQLFPTTMAGDAGMADPSPLIRAQVQNQVNAELKGLSSRVCSDDRVALQNLQSLWNSVHTQLATQAMQAASCTKPTLGTPVSGDPLPYNIQSMSNIMSMALACDLTRVASLQWSQALSIAQHVWIGSDQTNAHHPYSHMGPESYTSLIPYPDFMGPDPLYSITPAEAASVQYPQQLWEIDAWYAKQVAAFAKTLSQLPATGGGSGSLLDQTIICWGSELDMGNYHNHDDTPFLLIGGKGSGKVKTGQLVRFPLNLGGQYSTPGNKPPTNNRFHNDLLVTLAQIMGVTVTGLGGMSNTFGTTTIPGANFGTPGSITLNQGVIKEILP